MSPLTSGLCFLFSGLSSSPDSPKPMTTRSIRHIFLYYSLIMMSSYGLVGQEVYTFVRPVMGTEFRVMAYGEDSAKLAATVETGWALLERLEQSMSDYRRDSEVSRLTDSSRVGQRQLVSAELWEVLQFGARLGRLSRGRFDPTVGPLSKLWRRAFRRQRFPDKWEVKAARSRVGYRFLSFPDTNTVVVEKAGMGIDLGGIAKGYALEQLGQLLRRHGYDRFLLDGGGDLVIGQAPPGEKGWRVSSEKGYQLGLWHSVAVATSGSSYQYLEHDGKRYSHLIDPRTGYGVSAPLSLTVSGPDGMIADGLASVGSIISEKRFRRLLRRHFPDYSWFRN